MHLGSSLPAKAGRMLAVEGSIMQIGADLGEVDLQDRVRALLAFGKLPSGEACGVWGGSGRNEPCSICQVPIRREEVAFDLLFRTPEGDVELHMHRRCHLAWERARHAESLSEGEG